MTPKDYLEHEFIRRINRIVDDQPLPGKGGENMQFKVGDRARIVNDSRYPELNGVTGTIKKIDEEDFYAYHVVFDTRFTYKDGIEGSDNDFSDDELELVSRRQNKATKSMNKLSILARKLLDADTKKLVDAGFLDEALELTGDGEENLLMLVFQDYKEDLAKEARKVLKEKKKDCEE